MSTSSRLLGLVAGLALAWAWASTGAVAPALAETTDDGDAAAHRAEADADDDDRRRGHGRRIGRSIDEGELDDALELLERIKPDLAGRLASMRVDEPERAAELLHQRFPRLRYLLWLKDRDPAMYELRVRDLELSYLSRDLAARYTELRDRADDDEAAGERAAAMRDELSLLLEEQFDVRQQIRRRELERLEQRIAALREQIEVRLQQRDDVIARRLEELVDDDPR